MREKRANVLFCCSGTRTRCRNDTFNEASNVKTFHFVGSGEFQGIRKPEDNVQTRLPNYLRLASLKNKSEIPHEYDLLNICRLKASICWVKSVVNIELD